MPPILLRGCDTIAVRAVALKVRLMRDEPAELNPAQQRVVDLFGASQAERPTFDVDLATRLRLQLESGLAEVAASLDGEKNLFVNKHALSGVHGCEARYLAERDEPFTWTVAKARGSVAHRAIAMGVSWKGEPIPAQLVEETIAKAAGESDSLADWLRTCGEADRAELAGQAVERVTTFFECFPPLKSTWRPTLEGRLRAELFDGRIVLAGTYDLSLGQARGTTAGKVIIDFKTGGFAPTHVDEMRYYALLDTLRVGTPPRMVATYYLASGQPHPETVNEDLLNAAVARVVEGVARMSELDRRPEDAKRRPGPACRWCTLLADCDPGRAHLADVELVDDDPDW
jgi:hypothetical protein